MKIEGKVHLNMNSYNSITVDKDIIRVKSNKTVKSDNNDFTNSLNNLSEGDIKYKIITKFLKDNKISNMSTKLKYKDKEYIVVKDLNNHSLKIYNCNGFYMNILYEEYYGNIEYCMDNYNIKNYEFNYSTIENSFYINDNTLYINVYKNKKEEIKEEDNYNIKILLYKHVNENTYETFNNDKCTIVTDDVNIIMNLDLYRNYVSLIELIKIKKENDKQKTLKKGNK